MKTKSLNWMMPALLGLLIGLDEQAFYNPNSGRWLSRDPIQEKAGNARPFPPFQSCLSATGGLVLTP